jgi:hypothetical protein
MTQIINDIWSIFDEPPEDNSIVDWTYREIFDKNNHSNQVGTTASKFEFDMNDLEEYILPSKSYLEVKLKVLQKDATAFDAGAIPILLIELQWKMEVTFSQKWNT